MTPRQFLDMTTVLAAIGILLLAGWTLYIAYFKLGKVLDLMEQASGTRLEPIFSGPKGRIYLMIEVSEMACDPRFALTIGRVKQSEVDAIPAAFRRMARIHSRVNMLAMALLAASAGLEATGWFD